MKVMEMTMHVQAVDTRVFLSSQAAWIRGYQSITVVKYLHRKLDIQWTQFLNNGNMPMQYAASTSDQVCLHAWFANSYELQVLMNNV